MSIEKQHPTSETKSEKFYSSKQVPGPWDAIIIGSGASALTSGAMLAKAGKRVLLLEQHFQPGGYTHTFRRKNYEWDVGLHYLGKAAQTSTWYHQLSALTENRIELEPFDTYTDEIYFPDFHIRMPHRYEDYQHRLQEAFPHEKKGIAQYFDQIRASRRSLQLFYGLNLLPKRITQLGRKTFGRKATAFALNTTEQVMSRFIRDEKLKAVLDAQWGNIGAPRQHCSFMIHAAMLGNFLEGGAEYPIGGSRVFSHELGRVITAHGGHIRTKAKVAKLIVDKNKIGGVQLESGEELRSDIVISSIGVFNTYLNLLNDITGCQAEVNEARRLPAGYEYINLFIGFKQSPADFGLGKGNTWIHPQWDTATDEPTWNVKNIKENPNPRTLFFSSSSLRDPSLLQSSHSGFNGQIVSAVDYGTFSNWADSKWNKRSDQYYDLKDAVSDRLMTLLNDKYPGVKEATDYMELGTTLSYDHFCNSHKGIPYGLASSPARFKSMLTRPTTPIKNLYLCGQDMVMPGVPAAVGSANLCCALILKKNIGGYWAQKGRKLNKL